MQKLPVEIRAIVRRRRWGRWGFYSILALLFASIFFEHLGCFGWEGSDHSRFDQKTFVIEAVSRSGTVWIARNSLRAEVKLLGVDAQSIQPTAVAAYLGRTVIVKLEPLQTRDAEGRLLVYLYLDAQSILNVELVKQGNAKMDHSAVHSLKSLMSGAEADAKRRRRGIWK